MSLLVVCVRVCVYVWRARVCECVLCVTLYTHVCMGVCTQSCACACVCVHMHMSVCACIYVYVHVFYYVLLVLVYLF